mmetsp:Transcript_27049/g.85082  ORF Transcript_27049/g.85082 Transcript_27049/m.85082 type:complete len:288 (+) Transcript_27049:835-1698(+)
MPPICRICSSLRVWMNSNSPPPLARPSATFCLSSPAGGSTSVRSRAACSAAATTCCASPATVRNSSTSSTVARMRERRSSASTRSASLSSSAPPSSAPTAAAAPSAPEFDAPFFAHAGCHEVTPRTPKADITPVLPVIWVDRERPKAAAPAAVSAEAPAAEPRFGAGEPETLCAALCNRRRSSRSSWLCIFSARNSSCMRPNSSGLKARPSSILAACSSGVRLPLDGVESPAPLPCSLSVSSSRQVIPGGMAGPRHLARGSGDLVGGGRGGPRPTRHPGREAPGGRP